MVIRSGSEDCILENSRELLNYIGTFEICFYIAWYFHCRKWNYGESISSIESIRLHHFVKNNYKHCDRNVHFEKLTYIIISFVLVLLIAIVLWELRKEHEGFPILSNDSYQWSKESAVGFSRMKNDEEYKNFVIIVAWRIIPRSPIAPGRKYWTEQRHLNQTRWVDDRSLMLSGCRRDDLASANNSTDFWTIARADLITHFALRTMNVLFLCKLITYYSLHLLPFNLFELKYGGNYVFFIYTYLYVVHASSL